MTLDETIIYKELKEHLNSFPIGYPSTKSGVEMDLLKYFFTPEEARIATKLKFSWSRDLEPLETIYEHTKDLGLSIEELESHLDTMAKKGSIHFKKEKGKKYYSNAQFVIGMYEFQVNKLNNNFLDKFHKYLGIKLGLEVFGTKISQFRTIPVEKSITPEHHISSYDWVREIIQNLEGPIIIRNCICKEAKALEGEPCKKTNRIRK